MNSNDKIPDYRVYNMRPDELIFTLIMAMGACFLVGLIFYENIILSAILSLLGVFYIPKYKKDRLRKRKETLLIQFKDALYFINVSLSAGRSFESSITDTYKAMKGIYDDENSDMIQELKIMSHRILMNEPVESCFADLAKRSEIEDIKSFADVIMISKRSGANLVEVIKNTSQTISEKVEIKQEISTMIAGKKFEQKVLSIMPFVMVFFLKSSSPGFLEPLMNTSFGHFVMTIALAMIVSGVLLGQKIMHIEV